MKQLLCTVLLCAHFICIGQEPIDNRSREIAFINVNVIPMDREIVLKGQDVLTRNGRVTNMGKHGSLHVAKDALRIDGSGKFLMPGLGEMHAHVPPVDDLEPMKDVLLLFAVNGVTTIRGMLGHPRHLELRSKLLQGEILGPRFYTSGPSFNGNTVTSPEKAVSMVMDQHNRGYDFLKLHPGIKLENFNAIVKAAKNAGIPFAGHVSFDVGVWRAIAAGYASIDHMDGFVESLIPGIDSSNEHDIGFLGMFAASRAEEKGIGKLVDSLRMHKVWVVPTQSLAERWFNPARVPGELGREPEMKYMAPATVAEWIDSKQTLMQDPKYVASTISRMIELRRKILVACINGGVGLLLGSDAPQVFNVPGFSLHHELRYLVDAGLTPYQALRTGTANIGAFLSRDDLGIIRIGAVSDLVLLSANPLRNIAASQSIEGVMLGDRWLSKSFIETSLKKLEK